MQQVREVDVAQYRILQEPYYAEVLEMVRDGVEYTTSTVMSLFYLFICLFHSALSQR